MVARVRRSGAPAAILATLAVLSSCGSPALPSSGPRGTVGTAGSGPGAGAGGAESAAWLTYHGDAAHSGVAAGGPGGPVRRLWRVALDGQVYAEPLVSGSRVVAATEHDTVYALSAATGRVLWSTTLGTPVAGDQLPCGNISPSGITGTPVIDRATGTVWVVAAVAPGAHDLVGLRLSDGQVTSRRRIVLPGVDGRAEQERGALALSGGSVYVPFGGLYGDCGDYRGFVVGFPTSGGGVQTTFSVPVSRGGAVWAPPGPAVGPGGDLYIATGNGTASAAPGLGDSVVRLSPQLVVQGSFTPTDWPDLARRDLDLGSTSPALLPGDRLFQVGKAGVGYLLDRQRPGGVGGQLFSARVCTGEAAGGTAVDATRALVIVPCQDGLTAVAVGPGATFSVAWRAGPAQPGPPVVADGTVWDVTRAGQLIGLDEATGGRRFAVAVGTGASSFPSLAAAGGRLFVQAGAALAAYGS